MSELIPDDPLRRAIEEEQARLGLLDDERAALAARLAALEAQLQSRSADRKSVV